ncbi:hypothetical protein LENED_002435 [Lentinula edodes]|uniref:Uncharacterized protein n=1 Tax=Lentinula edodes TaxID=5353 RepID=A0A1Q3E107_LENED|nr:hypothetical protein LENED_002435 [Lentinula edodes]
MVSQRTALSLLFFLGSIQVLITKYDHTSQPSPIFICKPNISEFLPLLERRVLRLNSGDMVVTLAWKDPGQNHAATAPTANSFSICFGDTHGPNFCFEPRVISFKDSKGRMIPLVQEHPALWST